MKFKSELKYFVKWIANFAKWLWEPYQVYLFFAVPIFILLSLNIFHSNLQFNLVVTGSILQVVGVCLAIHGLFRIRKSFGKDGVHDIGKKWFQRFPKYKEGVSIYVSAAETGSDSMNAIISTGFKSTGTLDQRLDMIDQRINDDMISHLQLHSVVESNKSNNEREINILKKNNAVEFDNVRKEIGNHFTFNVSTEILGLSWIALGILFVLVSSYCN